MYSKYFLHKPVNFIYYRCNIFPSTIRRCKWQYSHLSTPSHLQIKSTALHWMNKTEASPHLYLKPIRFAPSASRAFFACIVNYHRLYYLHITCYSGVFLLFTWWWSPYTKQRQKADQPPVHSICVRQQPQSAASFGLPRTTTNQPNRVCMHWHLAMHKYV